jgi:hypothetical protein
MKQAQTGMKSRQNTIYKMRVLPKRLIIFLSLFAFTPSFGQVEKIKIKKEAKCNYKIQIDPKVKNKELTIGGVVISGLTSNNQAFFYNNTMFVAGSTFNVTNNNIEVMIQNICKIENQFLKKITIRPLGAELSIDFIYSKPK